jgi:phosphopentomutase
MVDKRVILIVLDSVGIGELPDAELYNDKGSNTLKNLSIAVDGLVLPVLKTLGLGNIEDGIIGVPAVTYPSACFGKMQEASKGKDTIIGHWEIAGIISKEPFPVYPEGFPAEIIDKFTAAIGRDILWNKPASGTYIIQKLGEEHIKTGYPIVYTSADSVFQIAAHEDVISLSELYNMCKIARQILTGKHNVARVIARPFIGSKGNFKRTHNRKDFSIAPPVPTILDYIQSAGYQTIGIGKIWDIFAGKGITQSFITEDNIHGINQTIECINQEFDGIIFTNLIDFDTRWGHRNDIWGYKSALEEFDNMLPEIIDTMQDTDILFITADHGCDPTTPSTDHSREYVPLLVYGKNIRHGINLGIRDTFADIAQTIADIFDIEEGISSGNSFWEVIR